MRVGVVGPTGLDTVTPLGRESQRRPGGSLIYAGRALRRAGAEPVLVGKGQPLEGAFVLPGRPFRSLLRFTPEGLDQTLAAVAEPFTLEEIEREVLPRLDGCPWVHLGAQSAGDFPREVLAALAGGHRLLLDGQGLARGPEAGPIHLHRVDPADLTHVHALKLNELEARAGAGTLDPDVLRRLGPPEILVTRAERGAVVVTGDAVEVVPGSGVPFADPTGAGDSWSALYALARSGGQAPGAAARYAVAEVERIYGESS